MAAEKDYTRLGLFLIISTVVILGTVLFFVQRLRDRPAVGLVTYTSQNVVGLKPDSPVRFKGVTVGRVDRVAVSADSRLVEIGFELFLDQLTGLSEAAQTGETFEPPRDMRTSVVGNPITGEAYVLIDTPRDPPPPMSLDFEPERPYMPSVPSPIDAVRDRLPELIERGLGLVDTAEHIVARLPTTLDKSDAFFTNADRILRESELPEFTREFQQIADELDLLLGEDGTLSRFLVNTEKAIDESDLPATMKSLRAAAGDARETLDRTNLTADDVRRILPAARRALEQLRALALLLEEQSEAILYSPTRKKEVPK